MASTKAWPLRRRWALLLATVAAGLPALAQAQPSAPPQVAVDPGPRGGGAGAGGPLPGLGTLDQALFSAARDRFQETDSVSGTLAGEAGIGLGPRFNLNSCAGCHAQPAVGGSSPAINPQIAVATLHGATNAIPSFIGLNGPVREARFLRNPDGTPDGGVHDLFVITGRSDAPGCRIQQPDFAQALQQNNVVFRIPTPVFGLGLVENIADDDLVAALQPQQGRRRALGIAGHFNRSGNDGSITRFGWKAQNKSLLIFAGEAYNVEQGVTNEAFPNERETDAGCQYNNLPEDNTNVTLETGALSPAAGYSSDVVNFAMFMRLSAPPVPAPATPSSTAGRGHFTAVGCDLCHVPEQKTARSTYSSAPTTFQPFSDFAVHAMGKGLADGVAQGNAGGDEFRTAPLWGLGQRLFFLHDGRTRDLAQAIEAHQSEGSEANGVVANYRALPAQAKQDLLNFLRSL